MGAAVVVRAVTTTSSIDFVAEVEVGSVVAVTFAGDELTRDGVAGGSLLAGVSAAERTRAAPCRDIRAPVALAGEVRHQRP
jgi:hypothetical protein